MQSSKKNSGQAKAAYWREAIRNWEKSGKSQAAFCRERRLTLSTFTYWRKRLVKSEEATSRFYPLVVATSGQRQGNRLGRLRLLVRGERFTVEVDNDFSVATLQKLVSALEEM